MSECTPLTRGGTALAPPWAPPSLGCVCTNQTCGSYFRLENEAAELLMLEGAQRAVASVDVKEWGERYAGPGQGLTLVYYSAQRKHILWDTLGA